MTIISKDDLLSIADTAIKKAMTYGVDEAEAFVYYERATNLALQGPIVNIKEPIPIGIGVRVAISKQVGFASASEISDDVVESTVKTAVDLAKLSPKDPDFQTFPKPVKRASRDGIINKQMLDTPSEDILKTLGEYTKWIFDFDKRINFVESGAEKNYMMYAVANSEGINDAAENAYIAAWFIASARVGDVIKSGFDYEISRERLNFEKIAESTAKRAIESLEAKPLKEKLRIPVIIENEPLSGLLRYILSYGLSGRNVMMKSSYYTDKEKQQVASEKFTLIDDGQMMDGPYTTKVDHEGIPRQKTILVNNGVLESFVYDSYSAYKLNKELTGNATRAGSGSQEPFNNAVDVGFSNLVVQSGSKDFNSFIESFDEAVVVKTSLLGVGHANRETGEFSIVAPNAFLWRNGELKPLNSVTLAGNFYMVLKNIVDIAGDPKMTMYGKIPTIAFEKITVS